MANYLHVGYINISTILYALTTIFILSVAAETYVRENHPDSGMRPSILLGSLAQWLAEFFTRMGTCIYNMFDPWFYWMNIKDYVIRICNRVVDLAIWIKDWSVYLWQKFIDGLRWVRDNIWQKIKDTFVWMWDRFVDFLDWAWPYIKEWAIWIKEQTARFIDRFKIFFMPVVQSVSDLVEPLVRCVTSGFYVVKGYIKGAESSACGPISISILAIVIWNNPFFLGLLNDLLCFFCTYMSRFAWFRVNINTDFCTDHNYTTTRKLMTLVAT